MKLLLDTHVLLWWLTEPRKLGVKVYNAIVNNNNEIWVSVASIWELAIKHKLGRIDLPHYFLEILHEEQIQIASIEAQHVLTTIDLSLIHQDPFDRLLIAQAKCDDFILVTKDKSIIQYPIPTLACL